MSPNKQPGLLTPPNGEVRVAKTFDNNQHANNHGGRNNEEFVSDTLKRGSFSTFNQQQFQNINHHQQEYQENIRHNNQSFVSETENQLRASNMEIHRLRKTNAKLRDDYSRCMKRLHETSLELDEFKRNKVQMDVTKQKDYEYIIKQDR
jgi:hypothetical protein